MSSRSSSGPRSTRPRHAGWFAALLLVLPSVGPVACTTAGGVDPGREVVVAAAAEETVVVDGADRGREFQGLGGVSAGGSSRLLYDYPEPARSAILDYLFLPAFGANVQLLKVEIGGDMNGTVGSEASHMRDPDVVNCNRGFEWWLMEEAVRRNPEIRLIGLPWGAPGWFEGGYWSRDNIRYLLEWLGCARDRGLTIHYLGGRNEEGLDADWYVELREALNESFGEIQLIAADLAHTSGWSVAQVMRDHPAFDAATAIVGVHGPGGSRTDPEYAEVHASEVAQELRKPLWASEFSSLAHDVGAIPLARVFNRSYIDARITGQMIWALISAWYPTLPIADTGPILAEWPWSGYYVVGKSVWALAHTTQFTQPGWHYLDSGSRRLGSGATIVSLAAPENGDYTLVVEAMDLERPTTLLFRLENLPLHDLQVWETDLSSDEPADHFRRRPALSPVDGTVRLRIEPGRLYTITTLSGGGKGDVHPPATVQDQLALPFVADFEGVQHGGLARFFSDVNGAFEAAPCAAGRAGTCYRQVVTRHPIEWHGPDMAPTTLAGDPRWWGDYRVSSDVLLEDPGYVELLGRVEGVQGDETVSGYHLQVADDGAWRLYSLDMADTDVTLASGRVSFSTGRWHNLALDFQGQRIQVLFDDVVVSTVEDDRHRIGQVGLGTSRWSRARFDDVRVDPTTPRPQFVSSAQIRATATSARTENTYGYVYPASAAIDDRPETYWRSEWDPPAPPPHAITLDLGETREIRALAYRPRISGHWAARYPGSPITDYAISVSTDGVEFQEVARGTWRRSVASAKVANFDRAHSARYVRLEGSVHGLECETSVTASWVGVSATAIQDPSPDVREYPAEFDSLVPQDQISVVAESAGEGDPIGAAFDGDCGSATSFGARAGEPLPHTLTLDLGGSHDVAGLSYLPPQGAESDGTVTRYAVHISADGEEFIRVGGGDWPADQARKMVTWSPRAARFVRFEAVEAVGGAAAAAEIHIGYRRSSMR